MRFDIKSVIIGLLLGVVIMFTIGSDRSGGVVESYEHGVRWGLLVSPDSKLIVRDMHGRAFMVDAQTNIAVRVEYDTTKTVASKEQLILSR